MKHTIIRCKECEYKSVRMNIEPNDRCLKCNGELEILAISKEDSVNED